MPLTFVINTDNPSEIYNFERIFYKIEINKQYRQNKLFIENKDAPLLNKTLN